jgi:hypothetical protein
MYFIDPIELVTIAPVTQRSDGLELGAKLGLSLGALVGVKEGGLVGSDD